MGLFKIIIDIPYIGLWEGYLGYARVLSEHFSFWGVLSSFGK